MTQYDVCSLILYKQHYRDYYGKENKLPEDIFSSFGYYDGFKVEYENGYDKDKENEKKSNAVTFIEALYDNTHNPIYELNGRYGVQIIGMFRINSSSFLEHYKDSLYAAVGFAQINETYDIVNDPEFEKLISKIEAIDAEKNIMVFGTFDNADLIILIKGDCLSQIDNIINSIDELDEICYMHTITGISQPYLNESAKQTWLLQRWNSKKVRLDLNIDEFTIRIAAKDKNNVINLLQNIIDTKSKDIQLNNSAYIKNCLKTCDKLCIYGHHDIELIFKNAPVEFLLFSMLPKSLLSHDNNIFGSQLYNIESGYKYKAKSEKEQSDINKTAISSFVQGQQSQNTASKIENLMNKIKNNEKSLHDDPVIQALYNSLNTLSQFEGFQLADDIFCLVYPAINNFLNQYLEYSQREDKIIDENIAEMIEYINFVVQHSVHTDQMFLMIPGYCGSSFGLSTKLTLFYQWMAYEVIDILGESDYKYDVLLSPEAKTKPETKEIRYDVNEHAIIVRFGQKMLFQPDFCIILIHELAHYIGEKERNREVRADKCIHLISKLTADMMFTDVPYLYGKDKYNVEKYKQSISSNIENHIKRQVSDELQKEHISELYASDLEYMLKQLIFQIVCMDEKDSLFGKIFLPVNDAVRIIGGEHALNSFSDKQKATQMYCKIIEKIMQNCKKSLFEETMDRVIEKLLTTFKEVYSDIAAYEILKFDFQNYRKAFSVSENIEISAENVSPMQSIRELIMHKVIGESEEYHSAALELRDTYLEEQMFSYSYVQTELIKYAQGCHHKLYMNFINSEKHMKAEDISKAYTTLMDKDNNKNLYDIVLSNVHIYKQNIKKNDEKT
ncbi:MAG: hypothetical protein EGR89_06915 [[Eubacterium] rectale]|nr:hypothetical protein [Agathobacter rectalis]